MAHRQRRRENPEQTWISRPNELLLTKDLFQPAFQPRNLYYLDPAGKDLVPDPIFVPVRRAPSRLVRPC